MKKIDFKRICAKNFLCFGEKGIDINFSKYGNIILIKGRNLDTSKEINGDRVASNGSGKSSIPEIIVYGLFGKTIKNPKKISHKDILHVNAAKNLCVEIYWDEYKIERKRKPDSLRLWKSPEGTFDETTEITLGGMPATQKLIEDIIGLNYQTFINIFIFTDDNSSSFLECDAAEKRNIVENLLSLEKYRSYHDLAKTKHKEHLSQIKFTQTEIDFAIQTLVDEQKNLENLKLKKKLWQTKKIEEVKEISGQISHAEEELKNCSDDSAILEYEKAQEEIKKLLEQIEKMQNIQSSKEDFDHKKNSYDGMLSKLNTKQQEKNSFLVDKKSIVSEVQKLAEVIAKINKLEPGVTCSHCFGEIKPENYDQIKKEHLDLVESLKVKHKNLESSMAALDTEIKTLQDEMAGLKTFIDTYNNEIMARDSKIRSCQTKVQNLQKIKMPDASVKKAGIEEKIKLLKQTAKKSLEELKAVTPFDELIEKSQEKSLSNNDLKEEKQTKLDQLKELTDYLSFWTVAFGDTGIRKYIIDEIIPALNQNVNYWLQFLIDNKLEICFDNELNEKITKFPECKPLLYHVLSNGQRRRINLALSQSFAHVMSLNTGRFPSLIFLDEVTTNIDPIGVEGIYNMICELAREKQVLVTTHDHDLLELLNGCQELNLRMENGVSFLEK